MEIQYALHRKE